MLSVVLICMNMHVHAVSCQACRSSPHQRVETLLGTISGTDLFCCAIRGHAGMNGTIFVE